MRSLAVAFVLVSTLAAGCAQPALQGASLPLPLDLPSFSSVVTVIDPSGGQGEPSMGIAPDGTIFANGLSAPGSGNSGSVFKSTDGGATWKRIADPTAPMPNFDPDLAVSHDGTVWFSSLWLGCSSTGASKDGGKSWTTSHAACVPAAGDRQYVVPMGGCKALIYSHQVPTLQQMVATTTDCGATWTPVGSSEGPVPLLLGNSGWGGGGFWNVAKKSAYLTWTQFDGGLVDVQGTGTWHPAAAISRDEGKTWTLAKLPNAGGSPVGLSLVVGAADAAGNSYLAWAEAKDKDMAVYIASSQDDGKTWSKPILVDGDAGSKVFPAITAFENGHVAVAYYHADKNGYPSSVPADTRWNVTLAWTHDALSENASWERANLSTNSVRTGPICPDGTSCRGNRQLLDYFALHAMPDGRVASVWTSTDDVKGKTVNVFGATAAAILADDATATTT